MTVPAIQLRALIYKKIRIFFDELSYLEVDTPLLGSSTNTDAHIQSITAKVCSLPAYLQTSPEFAMKRLLAEGSGSIYQVCHAFRDEEKGRLHHPEFTLLEWYSLGFDYQALMDQLQQLICSIFERDIGFHRVSYFDSFHTSLNLDLASVSLDECQQCVIQHISGIDAKQLNRDDCLDLLISQVVAKRFEGFTFVYDYPASQASLSKIKTDNPLLAERFELFYNDMELANGFTELTDATEQLQRFQQDNRKRATAGLEVYPIDEDFIRSLEQGLPECSGVALGLDRLLMVMQQVGSVRDVMTLDTLVDI